MPGDEERGDLEPDARFALQVDERVEDRLEMSEAELAVEVLGESLQVHVRRVHEPVHLRARFGADVAGGHRDGLDAAGTAGARDVDRVLEEDDGIVVREGNAVGA